MAQMTSPMNQSRSVMLNEGFRPTLYKDSLGVDTVGIGFNAQDPAIRRFLPADVLAGKRQMDQKEAESLLKTKILPIAIADAKSFVGEDAFSTLDPIRQGVLVDMAYQLGGPRLGEFVRFKDALTKGNYQAAANEILNSQYAKQTPQRAARNAQMILLGARAAQGDSKK